MFYKNMPYVENMTESFIGDRMQYLIFIGLSLGVLGLSGVLYFSNKLPFQRFLGSLNPLVVFLFAAVLGFVFLSLLSRKGFAIYDKENLNGLLRFSALAALFGVIMILADTKIVFPAHINILFPESLLFYPAIAFLAEILFHVLPLTGLIAILNSTPGNVRFETIVWICILVAALIEPVYQTMDMASAGQFPLWAIIFVGVHIFLINFFQLLIFRKYDFISMYSFRLVYYMFWHIGWGYVRLGLLF